MKNLDLIKDKMSKFSSNKLAIYINIALQNSEEACEMCIYDNTTCSCDCEWGIEQYLNREAHNELPKR